MLQKHEIILKKFLSGKFHNKTPVGKPRKRWEDVIMWETLQTLGIQGWSRTAITQSRMGDSTEGDPGTVAVRGPWMDG
jgi:hypothetical protein